MNKKERGVIFIVHFLGEGKKLIQKRSLLPRTHGGEKGLKRVREENYLGT